MPQPRRFSQGEHACTVYSTLEERDALVAAYIIEGLEHGEQCLYGALSPDDIERADVRMTRAGIDVQAAIDRGAWVRLTPDQTHLRGGRFDAEGMLAMLNDATEAALNAGFTGFRACGDMTWLAEQPPGSDQVVAYEGFLNSMFERQRALGLCLYDRRRLPSTVIDHALATHASFAVGTDLVANRFYRPAVVSQSRAAHPDDVDWKLRELQQRRSLR
jgi:hypothetical protein